MFGKTLTKNITDHSDRDSFSFSFYCDQCGKKWVSQTIPFTSGGVAVIEHEEARQLVWAHEHQAAFDAANLDARMHFNHCPVCDKWVCDECFCFEETEHGGVCKECGRVSHKDHQETKGTREI